MTAPLVLIHSFAASGLAVRIERALAVADPPIPVDLDMDPGRDILGGPPLVLADGPDDETFSRAALIAGLVAAAWNDAHTLRPDSSPLLGDDSGPGRGAPLGPGPLSPHTAAT